MGAEADGYCASEALVKRAGYNVLQLTPAFIGVFFIEAFKTSEKIPVPFYVAGDFVVSTSFS
jgi:hypothetical protein